MLDSFIQFLKTGRCEELEFSRKDKLKFFGGVLLHLFIFLFFLGFIEEIILALQGLERAPNWMFSGRTTLDGILYIALTPVYFAIAYWLCVTAFDETKVKISLSAFTASLLSIIIWKFGSISFIEYKGIQAILVFILCFGVIYFIFSKFIFHHISTLLEDIWTRRFVLVIYTSAFSYVLFCLLIGTSTILICAITDMVGQFGFMLIFIFIRNQLNLKATLLFTYLLYLPILIIITYNYLSQ